MQTEITETRSRKVLFPQRVRISEVQESSAKETSVFECEGVSFRYPMGSGLAYALKDVKLKVHSGDFVVLCGPSGSGKSTLLNLLGLIEPLQEGDIFFEGVSYRDLTESHKNQIRRFQLGFVFQNFNLIDVLTAYENVEYFLNSQGLSSVEIKHRTEEALRAVDLWEHRFKKPHQMSGGQRQRVAIARAIAKKPTVIIGDEPTASLDQQNGREVISILKKLNEQEKVTIVLSSHDPMVLDQVSHKILLRDGQIQRF